ncbi:DUF4129 domain-containing transglutaminase family protein [Bacillaceae bacterium W0354]
MRLMKKEIQSIIPIVLYFGSMLLLIEWILPLEQVTDTGESKAFIIYILLCFILTASFLPGWVSSPLKLLGMLFVIDQLFIVDSFLTKSWFAKLFSDIQINFSAVLSQQWFDLTPLFRTFLFLVLLWMMSYLLYYWFVVRKKPLSFILITFIYLTVLDTFTLFDAKHAIIRAFIIGVILLASAHFHRILEKEELKLPSFQRLVKWVSPLLVVVMFSTVIGYAAPKYDPIWPDPVPFLKAAAGGQGQGGVGYSGPQRIGYDSNDERLGGGFSWDESTVFFATAPTSQYWKVETKDVYTGKGWIRSNEGETVLSPDGSTPDLMEYGEVVERKEGTGSINFVDPGKLDKIPYMYGTEGFVPINDFNIEYNPITGEVLTVTEDGDQASLLAYSDVFYDSKVARPFFPTNRMREITNEVEPEIEQYLQLPDTLPERVVELAEEIIDGETNRYDQAKAIEQYFRRNGFKYEVTDVALPDDDEDYVDQFLFETKQGYCDNYSTSMVVLLRSVGIPARWVKGFTGGDRVYNQDVFEENNQAVYEIKNSNAHSWVEVYFPNVGWVPFEPTVGFSNQSAFVLGDDLEDVLKDRDYNSQKEKEEQDKQKEQDKKKEEKDETVAVGKFNKFYYIGGIILSVGLLAFLTWYIYRKRYVLLSKWKRKRLAQSGDVNTFSDAYQFLLKVLSKKGLPFKEGQTLREYAKDIDQFYGSSDMTQLTSYYERAIYRDEEMNNQFKDVYDLWNRMVNKLMS